MTGRFGARHDLQIYLERERDKVTYWAMSALNGSQSTCVAIMWSSAACDADDRLPVARQPGLSLLPPLPVALLGDRVEQLCPPSGCRQRAPRSCPGEQAGANDGDAKSQSSISARTPSSSTTAGWARAVRWRDDKVPGWSTSIEGVTGLLLSPDETKLLLVWERGGEHGRRRRSWRVQDKCSRVRQEA